MKQTGEPSVEEILESIKKVIARDNRMEPRLAGDRAAHAPLPSGGDLRVGPLADGLDDADHDEILDLAAAGTLAEPAPLIADTAVASMRESLAALATLSGPGAAPQIVRSGETSLEGLVRDLLRPMLAEWLDRNLPPLVERMVAAEIGRIVGKKV